jgi:hypothetical protein
VRWGGHQWIAEQRHRDLRQTLRVPPLFLHNEDRIEALIAIIGIAMLIFWLIEGAGPQWPAGRAGARRPAGPAPAPGR